MIEVADILSPPERMSCWDWNVAHVDYGLDRTYKSAVSGEYDPALMPWWEFPVNRATDLTTKEFTLIGPSQIGKEEHLLCMPARYHAATGSRKDILYVGHQEEKVEKIFRSRVIGGMGVTEPTTALMSDAQILGFVYKIGGCKFDCTHSSTGGGLKGEPWDAVYLSEVSSFKSLAILDEARKRGLTRPFFKLVMWGCPDWRMKRPSDEDVLFIEYESGTQHEYCPVDPVTGNRFIWDVGDGTGPGLRWDDKAKRADGSYDFDLIEKTAYYLTPDGTRIEAKDRWKVVCTGEWIAQNKTAPASKVSAHVHQLMMPWEDAGGFGHIARRLMESIKKGPESHRAFRYEVEARKWYGQRINPDDDIFKNRQTAYRRGECITKVDAFKNIYIGKKRGIICEVDVQDINREDNLYWSMREWVYPGDSGLVNYGHAHSWKQVKELAVRAGAAKIFIDNSYEARMDEVYEQCIRGVMRGAIPVFGRDNVNDTIKITKRDPFDGLTRPDWARNIDTKITMVTFHKQRIRSALWQMITGQSKQTWNLPEGDLADLFRQYRAEFYNGDTGMWEKRWNDNHWLDCEDISFVGAKCMGYYTDIVDLLDEPEKKHEQKQGDKKQPEPAVEAPWVNTNSVRL